MGGGVAEIELLLAIGDVEMKARQHVIAQHDLGDIDAHYRELRSSLAGYQTCIGYHPGWTGTYYVRRGYPNAAPGSPAAGIGAID